jgi:hypothetical protein
MPLITVGSGAPDVEAGTYPVTCVGMEPKRITIPATGEEKDVFDWRFTVDGSDSDGQDPLVVNGLTSQMTGPKSKTVQFLTALLGPEAMEPGRSFDLPDIVGKQALGVIELNPAGWPKITGLVPLPRQGGARRAAPVAAPAAAPTPPVAQPAQARAPRATVAQQATETQSEDGLPF